MNALDKVLQALEHNACAPKQGRDGHTALCPAHDDREPSLSVTHKDNKVLLCCHAGCGADKVTKALGLEWKDLFDREGEGSGLPRQPRNCAKGLRLEEYAKAKGLPLEFLRGLGLADAATYNPPAIAIPYRDQTGATISTRYRTSLEGGSRFKWKKGDKPSLYGLDRLEAAEAESRVVLVEGESDAQTLWHHGFPALGVPGASTWKQAWEPVFQGISTVYLVYEPDQGGATLLASLSKSALAPKLRVVELAPCKDPSELHLSDPDGFPQAMNARLDRAETLEAWEKRLKLAESTRLWPVCEGLANSQDVVARFAASVGRTVAGDLTNAKILFLALVSRLLDRPASIILKGPSSSGKSFVLDRVLDHFPESAYLRLTSMSDKALLHMNDDLRHRFIILCEHERGASDIRDYAVRSLLSEGRLNYMYVEKDEHGQMVQRSKTTDGPTGLITTTTSASIHAENETRLVSLTVDDDPKTSRTILKAIAKRHESASPPDLSQWRALQSWLEAQDRRAVFPLGTALAELVPVAQTRVRRDFATVLTLIETHALLHRETRDLDSLGRVLATIEDYRAIRDLLETVKALGAPAAVKETVRQTVQAVEDILAEGHSHVAYGHLVERLCLDPSNVSRRANEAIEAGLLKALDDKAGCPRRLILGDPLPEAVPFLPTPEDLLRHCAESEGVSTPLPAA